MTTAARYTPVASMLPSVFQRDEESFDQIDSFLGLVDHLHRAYADRLEQIAGWLSPDAGEIAWPPDVAFDAGPDALLDAYRRVFDELASWTGFEFPSWWTQQVGPPGAEYTAIDLDRRRDYLAGAARFWRRRATPRGFVAWVAFAFRISPRHTPYLLEHFKFGRPDCPDAPAPGPPPGLRATLLVHSTPYFDRTETRQIMHRFVQRYAPAHVHIRVCWVADDFSITRVTNDDGTTTELPLPQPRPDDPADEPAWRAENEAFAEHVRCLLCKLVDETEHQVALRVMDCIDEGESRDRLGTGRLPTEPDG